MRLRRCGSPGLPLCMICSPISVCRVLLTIHRSCAKACPRLGPGSWLPMRFVQEMASSPHFPRGSMANGCTLLPGYLACLSCSRRRSRCSTGMPSCVAAAHMEMSTYVRPQCLSTYERSRRAACRVVLSSGTTISCRQLKPSPRSQSAMASLMWLWRSSDRPPSGHVRGDTCDYLNGQ